MIKYGIIMLTCGMSVTAAQAQTVGATVNQNAVGAVLASPLGVPDVDATPIIGTLSVTDATARANALAQLTPQAYTLLPDLSLNAPEAHETNILRYLRDLRGAAERPDGTKLTIDEAGRVGIFANGGARFGSYKGATDRPRVQNDNHMAMGGINFRLTPKTTIGGFGGWMQSDVDLETSALSAPSRQRNWFAGAFGTVGVGPLYVDGWGSYTDLNWRLSRGYELGATSGVATARSKGRVWAAGAATGLSFSAGNVEIEPFAAIRYADIRLDGFTETGAPAALSVGEIDAKSLRLNLGGRLGTKFDVGNATVRLQGRGGWYKEFKRDDRQTLSVSFTNAGIATPFTFTTTPLSGEYYNAGAALHIAGNGPLSMVVDYDTQFDDDREFHALSLGARLKF